jgi:hypothetical protein
MLNTEIAHAHARLTGIIKNPDEEEAKIQLKTMMVILLWLLLLSLIFL